MQSSTSSSKEKLFDQLLNLADAHFGTDSEQDFEKYKDDPVGFCEEKLGATLTDDQKIIAESFWKYQYTLVKSANAVGKTHGRENSCVQVTQFFRALRYMGAQLLRKVI
jgi:hypothetical protein